MRPPGVPEHWVLTPCSFCRRDTWFDPAIEVAAKKAGQRMKHSCSEWCSFHLMQQEPSVLANMDQVVGPLWDIAMLNPGTEIDIGRMVACDDCGADYTDSTAHGGYIWHNRATCPTCADRVLKVLPTQKLLRLMQHGSHCPEGISFADFVREARGGNNTIKLDPPK